jgi:hypothetical protein
MHVSCVPCAPHAPPISFVMIWTPEENLVSSTDHKAPRYVVFSTPLLPRPSLAQISSTAPYSRTPSADVPPLMWQSKFHIYKKQLAFWNVLQNLMSCAFSMFLCDLWTTFLITSGSGQCKLFCAGILWSRGVMLPNFSSPWVSETWERGVVLNPSRPRVVRKCNRL